MEFLINPGGQKPEPAKQADKPAAADVVVDGTVESFRADVIEASQKVPVIVDFWAPWCGPCKQLGPLLEKAVRQAGGMLRLVKVNVDENPELAAHFGVQSIPAVFAFRGGRPVDGFQGALPESRVRQFVDRLLGGAKPPLQLALDEAKAALEAGDAAAARAIYEQILKHDAANPQAVAGVIRASVAEGGIETAKKLAAGLAPELKAKPEVAAALSALELQLQAETTGDVAELKAKVAAEPADHQARYDLALALFARGGSEAAVAELLELVRRNRGWNDEAARKHLLKIFDALGPAHPLTVSTRRQLSSILFS
jgi:putative thioredoxin